MAIWNRCAICGRAIQVGELLCYEVKNWRGDPIGVDTICRDCLVPENAPTLTPPNEWVNVEERLPTIEKDYSGYSSVSVNVFNGKSVLPMDYESSIVRGKKVFRWKYPWGRIYDGTPITHWMPLPAPPGKGNNVPTNEPLTLEQLREMDGEPVWVELYQAWALVEVKQNGSVMFYGNSFSCSYSRTWQVYRFRLYRRPPEGGSNETK